MAEAPLNPDARPRPRPPLTRHLLVAAAGLALVSALAFLAFGPSLDRAARLALALAFLVLGGVVFALWRDAAAGAGLQARALRSADERGRRFLGLLAVAADAYWEMDGDGRLVRFSAKDELRHFVGLRRDGRDDGLGRFLWETRGVLFDDSVRDVFRSELVARLPMRDVPLRWADEAGRVRHFTLNAEPRTNEAGRFAGYWGVLRDITRDVKAREALWSTETRYQNLFRRIPTPLVLHRGGDVLDANPAGVALFGCADLRALLEQDLVSFFEAGASRERAVACLRHVEGLAIGTSTAETEFTLTPGAGRRLFVRVSSVRVDVDGVAATLTIVIDDTERRKVEQALVRARDQAEAANRAKSAFLANTSHEIRTPLNALVGLAQLARTPEVDDLRRLQYVEQIGESADTLSGILSDILDLSKIEAGKLVVDRVAFDLHALIATLGQAYGALADTKGLVLRAEVGADVPQHVLGDPLRLRQVLTNYLTNALKFTAAGGIALNVRRVDGERLRFEVTDTGAGMDDDAMALLFQPFTQVDSSLTRKVGGTGLGLSICRELARLMDGSVGVSSEPGRGSVFHVELPLPPATARQMEEHETASGLDALQGTRVLMVEDNAVNMMIAVALLERWGAVVDQAGDGADALRAVDHAHESGDPFDIVLMDVQMPGMSGHEVARRLRQRYDRHALPIVALTAAALVSEREVALAAGMNDFLTKPIDAERLRRTLGQVLLDAQAHGGRA